MPVAEVDHHFSKADVHERSNGAQRWTSWQAGQATNDATMAPCRW